MMQLVKEKYIKRTAIVTIIMVLCFAAIMLTANAQPVALESKYVGRPDAAIFSSQSHVDTSHRGRVPEPSTVALIGSGFLAAIVRFARRRFAEFKRGFDILVSLIGLLVSSPILLMAMLLVKLTSKGPIFFSQTRVGCDGQTFVMYKLRSMISDAELQTGPVWAKDNDPRVTFIGKFLRKSRVDEIPQLVNVLKGEMSIIGPRPERPEFVSTLSKEICDYQKRLKVRPGITGLAQIKQSYDVTIKDVRRKVKFDLLYIKRMCFLTDLRILLDTVSVVLTGRGAR